MWIGVVSLFPEMFRAVCDFGITGSAVTRGLVQLETWNPRDFAKDRHRTVDDKPYGGGPGMVMKVQPLREAIHAAQAAAAQQPGMGGAGAAVSGQDGEAGHEAAKGANPACPVIYLSPAGKPLKQPRLNELARLPGLILIAGRYEGVDERLINTEVDEEMSVCDFVVSGGELPAMMLVDALTRLLPGAVGNARSVAQDSFMAGCLDYPHYTRPEEIAGQAVPEVLLSGNHDEIDRWRRMMALGRTWERRPDLFASLELSDEDRQLISRYHSELK